MMPTQDSYLHGTFSWVELKTTDLAAAREFYGALLGWSFEDGTRADIAGAGMADLLCSAEGSVVCGLSTRPAAAPPGPASWLLYITVDDIDETSQKMVASGGRLLFGPVDVGESGRKALLMDPTGAVFALWQAKGAGGAQMLGVPGAMRWNELYSSNVDVAGKFYVDNLGWMIELVEMGAKGTYTMFNRQGDMENAGGMMALTPEMEGVPPHWLEYFSVHDTDESCQRVEELGGTIVLPPVDIAVGRFAIVRDPQGAAFGIHKDPFAF